MADLIFILKKSGLHFPSRGVGGSGDALVQSGGVCFPSPAMKSARRKDILLVEDLKRQSILLKKQTACIGDSVANNDNKEVSDLVNFMEEQQSIVPEAHTQSHIVKFVQEVNKKDAESATPLDEEHQVIPEAQTQSEIAKSVQTESHNVKSIEAVDKQVPEPFTPMDDQHLVVHEAQYYIELMKSVKALIDELQKEQ
ncbi:hypothetical protein HAX54_022338 [Datura stramonium]|uniref:Uncharacterized protein n=1 Tax=Datura stramonium TaxID=4076 RepID=A0ABS8UUC6_DATST|nr:hypothetical protein [Datura stramonium]